MERRIFINGDCGSFDRVVTATEEYAGRVLKSRAADYIIKPITRETIWKSLIDTKFSLTKTSI